MTTRTVRALILLAAACAGCASHAAVPARPAHVRPHPRPALSSPPAVGAPPLAAVLPWQRFPEPVPLTARLAGDLYWGCGVGLNHIELITGQPAGTVQGVMRRSGIALRHPGGRSPFLRRWRANGSDQPGGN